MIKTIYINNSRSILNNRPNTDIIKKISKNKDIIYVEIKDVCKTIYQNINNKVVITACKREEDNKSVIPSMNINNLYCNEKLINKIIFYCDKLDNNIKYSDSIKDTSKYLLNLVNTCINDKPAIINYKMIQDCVNMFHIYDNKNIKVNIYCDKNYELNYNNTIIKQILLNLISNAYKYNYENGNIIIKLYEYNKKKYLEIFNTGRGLDISNYVCNSNCCCKVDSNKIGLNCCIDLLDNPNIIIESCKHKYFNIKIEF